jgi:hypothetical protein
MKIFLWIISALWLIAGTTAIIAPTGLKKIYSSLVKPVRWLSILPIGAGLLFLWSAPASSLGWLIRTLGILGLIKGLFFLFVPMSAFRATLNWWLNLSPIIYRIYGILILLLAGLVILSIL